MSAANAPSRPSLVWRILTTPVGPRIFPSWERAPGVAEVVTAAWMPERLASLVMETARRTRLWRREKADIATELCAHFADGLAAGRTAEVPRWIS